MSGDSEIDEGMTLDEDFIDIIVLLLSFLKGMLPIRFPTFIFLFAHLLILLLLNSPLAKKWN